MSSENPTVEIDPEGQPQQTDDEEKPTVMAGQEGGQVSPTVDTEGAAFRPVSPPEYPTPPGPTPFRPVSPPAQPPTPSVPGDATMIMEPETTPIPLAWLAVLEGVGGGTGTIFRLGRETVVGRTTGELLLSEDPAVSGQHLKVKLEMDEDEEEYFVLYDLASSNGTYVGDSETYQDDESRVYRHVLADGDYILVGQTTLVFKQV